MLRRIAVLSMLSMLLAGCATAPDHPVGWYMVSPIPTANYPEGDINSEVLTWQRIEDFPSVAKCEDSLLEVNRRIHRPVDCIASNDIRLNPL